MKTTSAFALTIFAIVFCTSCEHQTIEPVMPPASYEGGGPVKGTDTKPHTLRVGALDAFDAAATIEAPITKPANNTPATQTQSGNNNGKMLVAKKHLQ